MNKVSKYFHSPVTGDILLSLDDIADLRNIKLSTKEGASKRLSKIAMHQKRYLKFSSTFEDQFYETN